MTSLVCVGSAARLTGHVATARRPGRWWRERPRSFAWRRPEKQGLKKACHAKVMGSRGLTRWWRPTFFSLGPTGASRRHHQAASSLGGHGPRGSAPRGVDGLPAIFYKHFWRLISAEVVHEVLQVLHGGSIPEGWNDTLVVLIPKVQDPKSVKDICHISLCNEGYKLVSRF